MWKKKILPLTKDQIRRGVVFSSILYCNNGCTPTLHEVMFDDPKRQEHIANLKDVKFFKRMADDFGWDVVEVVRV